MNRQPATPSRRLARLALVCAVTLGLFFSLSGWIAAQSGPAVTGPQLWVTPFGLDFGPVTIGAVSEPQTITLTNVGDASLAGFVPQAPSDPQFLLDATCATTLAPGASCRYTVRFAPTAAGLVFADSATTSEAAIFTFVMRGEGVGPRLNYTGRWLDFGAVPVGGVAEPQTAAISNTGPVALATIADFTLSQPQFSAAHDCTDGLPVGAACAVTAGFAPTATGPMTATAAVGTAAGPLTLTLTGYGSPAYHAAARGLDFGKVAVNTTSAPQQVVIRNLGPQRLVTWSAGTAADPHFLVSHDCAPLLEPGASCTVAYRFAPESAGAAGADALLQFAVDGAAVPQSLTVKLRGDGWRPQDEPVFYLQASPFAVDLGTVAVGTQSEPATVLVRNSSPLSATVSGAVPPPDNQFLLGSTCTHVLAPGASCTLAVRFRPLRPGAAATKLQRTVNYLEADGTVHESVDLTLAAQAFAVPGFRWSPRILSFDPTALGALSAALPVQIRSQGPPIGSSSVVTAPVPFLSSGSCAGGVPAGGGCQTQYRFAPSAAGVYTATVSTFTNLGRYTVTLLGAAENAKLWATPYILDFGPVPAGSRSASQHVRVRNSGRSALTLAAAPLPDTPRFTLTHDCPDSLAPGAACTLTYDFRPVEPGALQAVASLATNAGTRTIRLRGQGVEATGGGDEEFAVYLPLLAGR